MNKRIVSFVPGLMTLCENLNHDVVQNIFIHLINLYHCMALDIDTDEDEDQIWWTGSCSIGNVNHTHPRIYLRPPYVTTFVTEEEIEDLTTKEQFTKDLDNGEYPADCGHFKYETIATVIKLLEEGSKENDEYDISYRVYTITEWRNRDDMDTYDSSMCAEIDKIYKPNDNLIIIGVHPIRKGWIIHHIDCLLDELKSVQVEWVKITL